MALPPAPSTAPLRPVESSPIGAPPAAVVVPADESRPVAETVRVALLLPLSGEEKALGRSLQDAAMLALFDVAQDGFALHVYDTDSSGDGARNAVRAALADGANLILGPIFAGAVTEVAPAARAAGVNVIAFSNNVTVASDGVYILGLTPRQQIERIAAYAASRGIKRLAALVPDTPFGRQAADELRRAATLAGAAVVQEEVYAADQSDLNRVVRRLAQPDARRAALGRERALLANRSDAAARQAMQRLDELDAASDLRLDAVFLAESGARLKSVAPLLPYFDIDPARVRILGLASWNEPGLGREPALIGAWFAAPAPAAQVDFAKRMKDVYGAEPHPLASLAYDATALAAVLARAGGGRPNYAESTLTNAQGFAGTAGIFRLVGGGATQRGLAVLEVGGRDFSVVGPAPESFGESGN